MSLNFNTSQNLSKSKGIIYVLLENELDKKYSTYKDMFKKSKLMTENIIVSSYYIYSIKVNEFNTLLNDILTNYPNIKIPDTTYNIAIYKNLNALIINDNIEFKNNIDMDDIFKQLGIIINSSDLEHKLIIKNVYKLIKQQCTIVYMPEIKNLIVKYPIMFNDIETPMVLAIDTQHEKIIGYLNYRYIPDDKSMLIECIEVNPEYRNLNVCKNIISYFITQHPKIMKFELVNVGGLAGYSCYVDAFELHNFSVKIQFFNKDTQINNNNKKKFNNLRTSRRTQKLNLTKLDNITLNHKFNGAMYFIKKT